MFFCLIPFQNLIFPKDLDFKVNFEDKDQRGGWLSGAILIKDDSEKSASYEIYWGKFSHDDIQRNNTGGLDA